MNKLREAKGKPAGRHTNEGTTGCEREGAQQSEPPLKEGASILRMAHEARREQEVHGKLESSCTAHVTGSHLSREHGFVFSPALMAQSAPARCQSRATL